MDLWERILGFADAQAVLTAHQRGVFEALGNGSATSGEIASMVRLPVDSCERLLMLLAALELLERTSDGRYANTCEAHAMLVSGSDRYIGSLLPYVRHVLYPAWGRLDTALEQQAPQPDPGSDSEGRSLFEDARRLREFIDGMHVITYQSAQAFARAAEELRRLETVLDVGGASGAFLIALAERSPRQRGVVFDLPPVVALAQEYIEAAGMSGRITTHAGNFWEDAVPAGADGYALGFVLHDWSDGAGDLILDRIAVASRPGTTLIVGEYLLEEHRTAPLFAVRQNLNMLVSARGRERSESEYRAWFRRHGFAHASTYPAPYGKHYMVSIRM